MTETETQQVICVIGMHRSGTSCLIGSLKYGGLELGEHSTWNPHNQQGNHENPELVEFHQQLLADNAGRWDQPPRHMRYRSTHRSAAQRIIDRFAGYRRWGFKDPRTTLALPLWRSLIPGLQPVGIFRNPLAVVASLQRRESARRISTEQGLALWHHYNHRLYREYRRRSFPLFNFDWDEEHFHHRLNAVHQDFELQPLSPGRRFYNVDLRHFPAGPGTLPWRVRRLYRKLQALAG